MPPMGGGRVPLRAAGIAALAIAGIFTHLALRWGSDASPVAKALPLYVVLVGGGVPLVLSLALKLVRREFGSDLLAGISIVAVGAASGVPRRRSRRADALRRRGARGVRLGRASSVLQALARRMPLVAHRRVDGQVADVPLDDVRVGDVADRVPARDLPRSTAWSSKVTASWTSRISPASPS